MNILSLFDGISCGRVALERAGISITNYYASEIDKYAIKISQKNYPDIVQVGDICNLKGEDFEEIDLIIGGSPCQGFSFAGKQLNFNDPRSALFFEYVRLLKEIKPKYFLLENVRMKQEYQDVISEQLGVSPIMINSSLVSAQNRVRLYWTNIPNVQQPEDKHILLKDIIEEGVVDRDKSMCIDANYFRGTNFKRYTQRGSRQAVFSATIVGRKLDEDGKRCDYSDIIKAKQVLELGGEKSRCLTSVQKDSLIYKQGLLRKLTPVECERLQTLPDNYTEGVSNSQRYKMLGNGWTVDVLVHIFKGLRDG